MSMPEIKRLAEEYAHVYAFVSDDTMPIKQAELYAAIDLIEAKHKAGIAQAEEKYKAKLASLKDELVSRIDDLEFNKEETRVKCAGAYRTYVNAIKPSDWDDHDAEQAILNAGKRTEVKT